MNQANNTFWLQKVERGGGRYLLNSNSDRIDRLVKDVWVLNFKDAVQHGVGKLDQGKMVIDPKAKVKIVSEGNSVTHTLNEWSKVAKTPSDAVGILHQLGIRFSDPVHFMAEYEQRAEVREAVKWVLIEVAETSLSDLYEGDLNARLKTLINIETEVTRFAIDNQP